MPYFMLRCKGGRVLFQSSLSSFLLFVLPFKWEIMNGIDSVRRAKEIIILEVKAKNISTRQNNVTIV